MPRSKDPQKMIEKLCKEHPTRVLEALLEIPFFPDGVFPGTPYDRYEDDSRHGKLHVTFGGDGDAWLMLIPDPEEHKQSLRFRSYFSGGQSLRVRNALAFLALAINLDNKKLPQKR